MNSLIIAGLVLVVAVAGCTGQAPGPSPEERPLRWGMVVHTGAGNFTVESLGDRQAEMRSAMTGALMAGHAILAAGGSSLDAAQAAVVILEDSPQFNAGKGAVFTHEGTNELDASIMDGRTMMAGAVAGVKRVKNPIRLARLVMEKSPHVMMVGGGAEAFGREQGGLEFVPESYFHTDLRWQQLQRALEEEKARRGEAPRSLPGAAGRARGRTLGRWAGEDFIRFTVAKDICARVEYRGVGVQAAADEVIHYNRRIPEGSRDAHLHVSPERPPGDG